MADKIFVESNAQIPIKVKLPANVKILIDQARCIQCGVCVEVCPFGLPQIGPDQAYTIPHPELCTECSACKNNCPAGAIILEEQKGCGCLWDVRARKKQKSGTCCDSDQNDSRCC